MINTFKKCSKIIWKVLNPGTYIENAFRYAEIKSGRFVENQHSIHKSESKANYLVISYSYLTFIGLGSKAIAGKDVKRDEKKENEWGREKDISRLITLAEKAIKAGDLKEAETILQQALRMHEENNTVGVTCVYDMLATLAYREGNIERAKDILEKVIKYLGSRGVPTDNNDILAFKLKLARILSQLGRTNEAEKNFRHCLEMQKLKQDVGLRSEEMVKLHINCFYWYGRHLMKNRKFVEARHCFDSAYTLSAQANSLDNNQVMVILYNLSDVLIAIGERDTALKHLLSAVILGKWTNSPDLPMYYNKIGIIYLSKGVLREARRWCESGRERAKLLHNKTALAEGENCIKKIEEMLKLGPLKV